MTKISAISTGILYIVATPIGHRGDISFRALETLQSVDVILAEDTRHSSQLLTLLGIKKPLISLHAHNEADKSKTIIEALQQGQSFALISDAGTPLISDPGYPLVRMAQQQGITVTPIPGACALITALCAAGVACDMFTFCGFLPAKHTARLNKLEALSHLEHTLIFYESTHRIIDSIQDIEQVFGESCEIIMAKELTKTFERFISGSCRTIIQWLREDKAHCKGEFVLIISPRLQISDTSQSTTHLLTVLLNELPLKQAVKIAHQLTKDAKNDLYEKALLLQNNAKPK
jgi:16S rRNA (cytidine1402-2'-O)-methyltransferase